MRGVSPLENNTWVLILCGFKCFEVTIYFLLKSALCFDAFGVCTYWVVYNSWHWINTSLIISLINNVFTNADHLVVVWSTYFVWIDLNWICNVNIRIVVAHKAIFLNWNIITQLTYLIFSDWLIWCYETPLGINSFHSNVWIVSIRLHLRINRLPPLMGVQNLSITTGLCWFQSMIVHCFSVIDGLQSSSNRFLVLNCKHISSFNVNWLSIILYSWFWFFIWWFPVLIWNSLFNYWTLCNFLFPKLILRFSCQNNSYFVISIFSCYFGIHLVFEIWVFVFHLNQRLILTFLSYIIKSRRYHKLLIIYLTS